MIGRSIGLLLTTALVLIVSTPVVCDQSAVGQGSYHALSTEEIALLGKLDVGRAMADLETLCEMGEKASGGPVEIAAQEWVYERMRELPLDTVEIESFPTTSWTHCGDRITIASAQERENADSFDGEEVPCAISSFCFGVWGTWYGKQYSFGTEDDGLTLIAPVIDVGLGTVAELDEIGGLDGSIALVERDDSVTAWPNVVIEEVSRHGASAVVSYGYTSTMYGHTVHPDGIKQNVIGGPLPYFAISVSSATHIIELLQNGEVVLALEGEANAFDAAPYGSGESVNVIGYLEGTTHPDEYILFSSHMDTFWDGAWDTQSGVACVLEYARVFSEARETGMFVNERTIVFISVGCEEAGGPADTWYNSLIGSYEFVRAHPEVMEGLVVALNLDGVSLKTDSGVYWVESTWEINDFITEATYDLGELGQINIYNPVWSWTDAWSYGSIGGGSAAEIWWTDNMDVIYHTQLDNYDLADEEPVDLVLRLYTVMATRAANAIVLPLNLLPTLSWAEEFLRSEAATLPYMDDEFEAAQSALDSLKSAVVTANLRSIELEAAYASAKPEERAAIRAEADALNGALIDARRIVTSWTVGMGGKMASWDVFLRPEQHVHDLSCIDRTIQVLETGIGLQQALNSLASVYTMEWGHLFSPDTYAATMGWMINDEMYWGDDFDQQQYYVNVHWIYAGLRDGTLTKQQAMTALDEIRRGELMPWIEVDLLKLEWAWLEAVAIIDDVCS
ncbi:MAG: M28 family peptidase [Methanobacteriota archaeon]|nr:MAG: M28 family peptidase [Euryarchaeota archaeon]